MIFYLQSIDANPSDNITLRVASDDNFVLINETTIEGSMLMNSSINESAMNFVLYQTMCGVGFSGNNIHWKGALIF